MNTLTGIVGYTDGKVTYIAGDTLSGNIVTTEKAQERVSKVFKLGKEGIIAGGTYTWLLLQLLQFGFNPPKLPKSKEEFAIYKYMVMKFGPALRKFLRKHDPNYVKQEKDGTLWEGGALLVGIKNELYMVTISGKVFSHVRGYEAVGCGSRQLTPAMGALIKAGITEPKQLLLTALQVSDEQGGFVEGPFNIINTKTLIVERLEE